MAMALSVPLPSTGEPVYYSVDMVDALNASVPGRFPRYECVYGELLVTVTAARPWHYEVGDRLWFALKQYAAREPAAGHVGAYESKITFGRPDVYVSPDIWAVRAEAWRAQNWDALGTPMLLAEVLSPSTRKRDRFKKRIAYMRAGVPLYWIVDADAHAVDVWTPGLDFPHVERTELVWEPAGAAAPFRYALAELFAPL